MNQDISTNLDTMTVNDNRHQYRHHHPEHRPPEKSPSVAPRLTSTHFPVAKDNLDTGKSSLLEMKQETSFHCLVANFFDDKGYNPLAAILHHQTESVWYCRDFESLDPFEYSPDLIDEFKFTSPSLKPIFYGTYSSVYRRTLLGNDEPVTNAVKVLKETALPSLRREARRESRTWATPTAGPASALASYDSVLEAQRLFYALGHPPSGPKNYRELSLDSLFPHEGARADSLQNSLYDSGSPVFQPPIRQHQYVEETYSQDRDRHERRIHNMYRPKAYQALLKNRALERCGIAMNHRHIRPLFESANKYNPIVALTTPGAYPADAIESLASSGNLMSTEQGIDLDVTIGTKYEHSDNAILIYGDLKLDSVRDGGTQANGDELQQDQVDAYQRRLKFKQTIDELLDEGISMHIPQVVVAGSQLFEGNPEILLHRNAGTCTGCPSGHAELCSSRAEHSEGDSDLPSAIPSLGATPVALKKACDSIEKEKFGGKDSDGPRLFMITGMEGRGKTIPKFMHSLEHQLAKILFIDGNCGPVLGVETAVASDEPLKWNIESFNRIAFSPASQDLDSGSLDRTGPPGGPDPADLSGQVVIPDYRMPKFGRASLVYRGVWQDKQVAVKVLKARKCVGKATNWERKMRKEIALAASMWAALKHPNILPLSGYSDDFGDFGALISPWCEQGTAQQYLAGRNLNYQKRARLALDVCEGLRYLHRASIIHGDIKPMNILIDDGVARLCDFGLSRLVRQQELGDLTSTTVYDGPERYMAPEIFASVDAQRVIPTYVGDIYALGCIMLEFVEGVYPFKRLSSNREVIDAILSRLPPALRCESTHTSPITMDALWTLLDTCWGEPSSRPSMPAVVECVAGLVNSEGVKDLSPIVTNGSSCRKTDRMGRQAGNLEEGGLLYRSSGDSDIAGAGRPRRGWKWIRRKKGKPMAPMHVGASET